MHTRLETARHGGAGPGPGLLQCERENGVRVQRLLCRGREDSAGGLQTCCCSTQRKEEEKGWGSTLRPGVQAWPPKQGR